MTPEEIKVRMDLYDALRQAFYSAKLKLLPDHEEKVLQYLSGLGVTADAEPGYLRLRQGQTDMVIAAACTSVQQANPMWFISTAKDRVICREDLERGSQKEIASAKSAWIKAHGLDVWERLPRNRSEAEAKAIIPDASMNRAQYLQLTFREKSALAGALGPVGIGRIMARVN